MKVSVLTPTYNRANTLTNLYDSLKRNSKYGIEIEWLIMDDGSTDNTNELIERFQKENIITILYEQQENKGKMAALNNLVPKATGDYIIECDSDDFFTGNAFEYIAKNCEDDEEIYAYAFLKYDQNHCNIGNLFDEENNITTMFDLYFKQGEDGEKALVFNAKIRKQFSYELEKDERFITEARMHHKMDKLYKIKGINLPLMICEYREDGYTKNIREVFKKYPYRIL
ncbi:MAG: glycosyltransferase family 2 protein [Clostridia bacterium]|nr:glycosyltransferase family 2 protein [Clostridia bacterium]